MLFKIWSDKTCEKKDWCELCIILLNVDFLFEAVVSAICRGLDLLLKSHGCSTSRSKNLKNFYVGELIHSGDINENVEMKGKVVVFLCTTYRKTRIKMPLVIFKRLLLLEICQFEFASKVYLYSKQFGLILV